MGLRILWVLGLSAAGLQGFRVLGKWVLDFRALGLLGFMRLLCLGLWGLDGVLVLGFGVSGF